MPYNLINTRIPAPRQMEMLLQSLQQNAYYAGVPYPRYAFGPAQWPADRGPIPTCLPYVETLINESAEFVFKNGSPSFSVVDNPDATELLREIIEANGLDAQWVSLAQNAGLNGAIAVKFSVDMSAACPIRISFLEVPTQCRFWIDPLDATRVLMARVQFPYRNPETGDWLYFREEFTDEQYVTYKPLLAGDRTIGDPLMLPGYLDHMGDEGDFEIDSIEPNPFGVIPISVVRNRMVKGNPLGEGDCWRVLRLIDRIARTMHGEDQANQFHSTPSTVFLNGLPDNVGPLMPGEPIALMSAEGSAGPADVKMLTWDGKAREYTHKDIAKWEQLLYNAVGMSLVDPESVSNKGSLSEQVLRLLYQRTISTSDHKRENWGNSGLCVFFRNLLVGLSAIIADRRLDGLDPNPKVVATWPDYFAPTDSDLSAITDRTTAQMNSDLITHEAAIERIGHVEDLDDTEIEAMKPELLASRKAKLLRALPQVSGSGDGDASEYADTEQALGVNNFVA